MAVRSIWFTSCFVHNFLTDSVTLQSLDSVTLQSVRLQEKGAASVDPSAFSFPLTTFTS